MPAWKALSIPALPVREKPTASWKSRQARKKPLAEPVADGLHNRCNPSRTCRETALFRQRNKGGLAPFFKSCNEPATFIIQVYRRYIHGRDCRTGKRTA